MGAVVWWVGAFGVVGCCEFCRGVVAGCVRACCGEAGWEGSGVVGACGGVAVAGGGADGSERDAVRPVAGPDAALAQARELDVIGTAAAMADMGGGDLQNQR